MIIHKGGRTGSIGRRIAGKWRRYSKEVRMSRENYKMINI